MIFNLSSTNSVATVFLNELRDVKIQHDALRFRTNLRRLGQILGYEASKSIRFVDFDVQTPLGVCKSSQIADELAIATILRAGLPMHSGVLDYFDYAESAFITAYRKYHKSGEFEIKLEYVVTPQLNDKVFLLCDPMLATGASVIAALDAIKQYGRPRFICVLSVIASSEAISVIKKYDPDIHIYTGAIDEELTAKGYIVPGLGDAGDLAYGPKIDL
ncbi:MAG: uracil phosphoribosyltransferase [Chitinophagales bacterium]